MTLSRASLFAARLFSLSIIGLSLFGCATGYKAVREADLSEIRAQLQATERSLAEMEQEQAASRDLLFTAERESLHQLLSAVREHAESAECPAPEPVQARREASAVQQPLASPQARSLAEGKLVIGEVETVYVDPPGAAYTARIDTGAESSSLDAREVQTFERDGDDWVRFKMPLPGREELVDVERRVSRFVRILQSSSEDSERRPVIKMRIVIGSVERLAEFTLSDREHLEYPVLIGRNVLKDTMVVDVSRSRSVALPDELRNSETTNE